MVYIKFKDRKKAIPGIVIPISENVVRLEVDEYPDLTGFNIFLHEDMTAPLDNGEYENFNTLYKELDNGYELSNDGSIWVRPVKDVTVSIDWIDVPDEKKPHKVSVEIYVNGELDDTINLSAKNNWTKVFESVPEEDVYRVNPAELEGLDASIDGTTITYSVHVEPAPVPYEPTLEEQVADLTNSYAELDERVYALEEGGNA